MKSICFQKKELIVIFLLSSLVSCLVIYFVSRSIQKEDHKSNVEATKEVITSWLDSNYDRVSRSMLISKIVGEEDYKYMAEAKKLIDYSVYGPASKHIMAAGFVGEGGRQYISKKNAYILKEFLHFDHLKDTVYIASQKDEKGSVDVCFKKIYQEYRGYFFIIYNLDEILDFLKIIMKTGSVSVSFKIGNGFIINQDQNKFFPQMVKAGFAEREIIEKDTLKVEIMTHMRPNKMIVSFIALFGFLTVLGMAVFSIFKEKSL